MKPQFIVCFSAPHPHPAVEFAEPEQRLERSSWNIVGIQSIILTEGIKGYGQILLLGQHNLLPGKCSGSHCQCLFNGIFLNSIVILALFWVKYFSFKYFNIFRLIIILLGLVFIRYI